MDPAIPDILAENGVLPPQAQGRPSLGVHRYRYVLHAFYNQPWAITPEKLEELDAVVRRRVLAGQRYGEQELESMFHGLERRPDIEASSARELQGVKMVGAVALLPLFGVIAQRMNMFLWTSGGTSTEIFGKALDSLVADRGVRAIVIVADSPGGSVFGVPELAAKVRAARHEKKLVAVADSIAASAAYWIAAQASELLVTPGGQVGSVGVIAAHRDVSKQEEMEGVKTTLITAGEYKAEGAPELPLSAEGHQYLQKMVNDYFDMFVAGLAKGRGVSETRVRSGFGEGRMLMAKDAVAAGMADKVATLEQVVMRLGAKDQESGVRSQESRPLAAVLAAVRARAHQTSHQEIPSE